MTWRQVFPTTAAVVGVFLAGSAQASIVLTWYPASDYNSNTAAMNATLGLTGDTFASFESTTLISGLTINLNGNGVPSTTWTSLPNVLNENSNGCTSASANNAWDGTDVVSNLVDNSLTSCAQPSSTIAQTITFDYAPGTTTFGVGLSNFQSLDSPVFPFTNHELFVNGVDEGTIESLAGANWTPGLGRNGYLVITGTYGTTITSVSFENLTSADVLLFDHLAVAPAAVPEPAYTFLLLIGVAGGLLWRRRQAF